MPKGIMLGKRSGKQGYKKESWLKKQTKLNIPRGPFAYGNLLMKSQYCDFAMSQLLYPVTGTGQGQSIYAFSRMDWQSNVPGST